MIARYDISVEEDDDEDDDYDYYDDMYDKDLEQRFRKYRRRRPVRTRIRGSRYKRRRRRPVRVIRRKKKPEKDWISIDEYFNHPHGRVFWRQRDFRPTSRPSIFPFHPWDLLPGPEFGRRLKRVYDQNDYVPLSLLGKIQKFLNDL